jgi:hypothetical protein
MDKRHPNIDESESDQIDLEDPLGIAGTPVPHDERIHASNDEESIRKRRARAGLGTELEERYTGLEEHEGGATGIDMGYGGQGTNVSDKGTK